MAATHSTDPDGSAHPADLDSLVEGLMSETRLWQKFLSTQRLLVSRMSTDMESHHIPLAWFDVLIHLAMEPTRSLRQISLTDRVLLSESGTSRMLGRMAAAGLVSRAPDVTDRRGVVVTLSDSGAETLRAVTAAHVALVRELFTDVLDQTELATLDRAFSRLLTRASAS